MRAMPSCNIFLGLMSGTSADGIDAVAARIEGGRVTTLGHVYCAYPAPLRAELLALMASGADEIERMGRASVLLADAYAEAIERLIEKTGLARTDIVAVGLHGQTIRHRPEHGFSLQLNQPARVAERTGLTVVADFRSRDLAAGGQGAPLVPAFHAAMFRGLEPRAVVNIGGMANVTLLPAEGDPAPVIGFDTGPGNCLLDAWCERHRGESFDRDGAWAASGRVHASLLSQLLADPYFARPAPKSTGREHFHLAWLDEHLATFPGLPPEDVQASLLALTAETILAATAGRPLYVCGGGAYNRALMNVFAQRTAVHSTAELGIDPMQVEALAFAWLAARCLAGEPGNLPEVTGAQGLRVLGAIYPA